MPTAPPVSRDRMLEAQVFWHKFKTEIAAAFGIVILGMVGFGAYRLYTEHRNSAASALLGTARNAQDYQQLIERYANTRAGAAAYLLLAQGQRNDRKFIESNATLQVFIDKNPKHELVSTAKIAIASNLESMGKLDEALSAYQRVAAEYPKSFNAPLALISQVHLLKAKNQHDAARRVCETVLTQYRESLWASEAMRQLRSLKPSAEAKPAGPATIFPPPASHRAPQPEVRPPLAIPSAPPSAPTPASPQPKP